MYYWGIRDVTTGEIFEKDKSHFGELTALYGAISFIMGKDNVQSLEDKFTISIYTKPAIDPFSNTMVEREPIAEYEFSKTL